jgi:hypothetical protein
MVGRGRLVAARRRGYAWPGGFLGFLQRVAPTFMVGLATPGYAVVINGLMVVGLAVAAWPVPPCRRLPSRVRR